MGVFSDVYRFLPAFKGKKRLGKVLFKKAVYKQSVKPVTCKRGLKYYIINTHDSVGRDLFFDGIYEPLTIQKIEENLDAGDIMIDAGANIGAICLPVAQSKQVTLYAFEPALQIFETLQQNISVNHLKNIHAYRLAFSDASGDVDFYESEKVHGWSGIVQIDNFEHYTVKATTLDIFARENNIDSIAVLKADVQGWEYYVFKGAEQLIRQKRIKNIFFEFEWWAEKNAGLPLGKAQAYLLENGYSLQTLAGKSLPKPLTAGTALIHATI